jgi:hypothetical protein
MLLFRSIQCVWFIRCLSDVMTRCPVCNIKVARTNEGQTDSCHGNAYYFSLIFQLQQRSKSLISAITCGRAFLCRKSWRKSYGRRWSQPTVFTSDIHTFTPRGLLCDQRKHCQGLPISDSENGGQYRSCHRPAARWAWNSIPYVQGARARVKNLVNFFCANHREK